MKICSQCKEAKPEDQYNKRTSNKNGLQANCKECNKLKLKEHYKNNKPKYIDKNKVYKQTTKDFVNKYKTERGCVYCSEKEAVCLDFHHTEDDKETNVGTLVGQGHSVQKVLLEINKCIVVCSNCHRKLHAGLLNYPLV